MPDKPDQYVNAAGHGITLASGRPLAIGEHGPVTLIEVDGEQVIDPHDQALIDERHLVRKDPVGSIPDDEDLHGWLDSTSVKDILAAAADTPEDAQRIHDAEAARTEPRKTLLEALAPPPPAPTTSEETQS